LTGLEGSFKFPAFPQVHTSSGERCSPKITIKGLDCTSLTIVINNPTIRNSYRFASWGIWHLPALQIISSCIPHGMIVNFPADAMQGTNDAAEIWDTGHAPFGGEMHR